VEEAASNKLLLKRSNTINPDILSCSFPSTSSSQSIANKKSFSRIQQFNCPNRSPTITDTDDFRRIRRNRFKSFTLNEKDDINPNANSSELLSFKDLTNQYKGIADKKLNWSSLFKSISSDSLLASGNSIKNEKKIKPLELLHKEVNYFSDQSHLIHKPSSINEEEGIYIFDRNTYDKNSNQDKLKEVSKFSRVLESKEIADIR
jgi:hypothetical protein